MRDNNARHLATPLPLHRRWQLWTGVGVAVLAVVTAAAWIRPPAEPGRPSADISVTGAGASTTTAAGDTTAAQAANADGPKNLLANASFEDGSLGWQPLGGAHLTKTTEAKEGGYSLRISAGPSITSTRATAESGTELAEAGLTSSDSTRSSEPSRISSPWTRMSMRSSPSLKRVLTLPSTWSRT